MTDDFDLPVSLFWAGSDEATAENHLKHLENAVLGDLVKMFQGDLSATEAGQHFQGCSRRLLMMQYARIEILATAKEEKKPLATHRTNFLNICLNSYYLNLLGALDNLAWAVTYLWQLLPTIDESTTSVRRFCSLTSRQLIDSLSARSGAFGQFVAQQSTWIGEVKRFRDPAAHRLPLAIVRGVMTPEEGRRYHELHQASVAAMLEDRWDESHALQAEAEQLGRFVPLLDGPRAENEGIYIVPNQMAADQRKFLTLTHGFLKHLAHAV